MKIDELINAVASRKREAYARTTREGKEPHLAVYVTYEYWQEMLSELRGEISCLAYETSRNGNIFGYPIYRVSRHSSDGSLHPPFQVVEVLAL